MSEQTKIEWCDHTFNPWMGCAKVSPGCAHCYAETLMDHRYGKVKWGKGQPRQRTSAANWRLPMKWNLEAMKYPFRCSICRNAYDAKPQYDGPFFCPHCSSGDNPVAERTVARHRPRVFCASLADWLDDEVPIEWLADLLKVIHDTPNLDWLLLTKRPENWLERVTLAATFAIKAGRSNEMANAWVANNPPYVVATAPANVLLGVSVEDQTRADERIPALLQIPARVRFLSMEPLLGAVDLWAVGKKQPQLNALNGGWSVPRNNGRPLDGHRGIDWVIIGGESGKGARACNVEWVRVLVQQCAASGVPCFVKQMGAVVHDVARPDPQPSAEEAKKWQAEGWCRMTGFPSGDHWKRILKLKHPKGGDMAEWPADLRVRQFPSLPTTP